jgi:hypothetical protein
MEDVKITATEAREIYPTAAPELKARLETAFGGRAFFAAEVGKAFAPLKFTIEEWEAYIIPLINSFEDACSQIGEDPADPRYAEGTPDEISYKRGKLVVRVLNGPFILSWKDGQQKKWDAWLNYGPSGFRFDDSFCAYVNTLAASGSRLRLCSDNLSKHFATKFSDMMSPYWDFDN